MPIRMSARFFEPAKLSLKIVNCNIPLANKIIASSPVTKRKTLIQVAGFLLIYNLLPASATMVPEDSANFVMVECFEFSEHLP